jgi:membrane-bound lytic murein transglycosylase B
MKRRKFIILAFGFIISALFFTHNAPAYQNPQSWNEWVKQLRVDAVANGIKPDFFDNVFQNIKGPNMRILGFERTQPEKRITFMAYRQSRADAFRIKLGRSEYRKNQTLLNEIGAHYGVNPCFIVSLWGLETSYGHFMGSFPVIQSLATLAYGSTRGAFFRKELLIALQIVQGGHVKLEDFKGEWAGASGHPQFMPSSWLKYAVDYTGNGHKDIWKTPADVFASIANYLVQHGWQKSEPWAIQVAVPAGMDQSLINKKEEKTVAEWQKLGIQTTDGRPWPNDVRLKASLIEPLGGPAFLVFNNFQVIMKWNHSTYYAGTVGYIAEQICGRPIQ